MRSSNQAWMSTKLAALLVVALLRGCSAVVPDPVVSVRASPGRTLSVCGSLDTTAPLFDCYSTNPDLPPNTGVCPNWVKDATIGDWVLEFSNTGRPLEPVWSWLGSSSAAAFPETIGSKGVTLLAVLRVDEVNTDTRVIELGGANPSGSSNPDDELDPRPARLNDVVALSFAPGKTKLECVYGGPQGSPKVVASMQFEFGSWMVAACVFGKGASGQHFSWSLTDASAPGAVVESIASTAVPVSPIAFEELWIGRSATSAISDEFLGALAGIAVFDTALTPAQIQEWADPQLDGGATLGCHGPDPRSAANTTNTPADREPFDEQCSLTNGVDIDGNQHQEILMFENGEEVAFDGITLQKCAEECWIRPNCSAALFVPQELPDGTITETGGCYPKYLDPAWGLEPEPHPEGKDFVVYIDCVNIGAREPFNDQCSLTNGVDIDGNQHQEILMFENGEEVAFDGITREKCAEECWIRPNCSAALFVPQELPDGSITETGGCYPKYLDPAWGLKPEPHPEGKDFVVYIDCVNLADAADVAAMCKVQEGVQIDWQENPEIVVSDALRSDLDVAACAEVCIRHSQCTHARLTPVASNKDYGQCEMFQVDPELGLEPEKAVLNFIKWIDCSEETSYKLPNVADADADANEGLPDNASVAKTVNEGKSDGVSAGVVGGAAAAGVVALLLSALVLFVFVRRNKAKHNGADSEKSLKGGAGGKDPDVNRDIESGLPMPPAMVSHSRESTSTAANSSVRDPALRGGALAVTSVSGSGTPYTFGSAPPSVAPGGSHGTPSTPSYAYMSMDPATQSAAFGPDIVTMETTWTSQDPPRDLQGSMLRSVGAAASPMLDSPAYTTVKDADTLQDAMDAMHLGGSLLLSKWVVLDALNRRVGGQSVVQFVRDPQTGEEGAIKFFWDRASFAREAALYGRHSLRSVMAAVKHVQSEGLVTPGGYMLPPFIVLEKGKSLQDWAEEMEPDFVTSLQVLVQVVQRLKALHELGLVHRDLKPANIMWRGKDWCLIDYGGAAMESLSNEAKVPISYCLPYAPPEVIAEIEAGNHRMVVKKSLDIWSLGVVVYELLMKKRLFEMDASAQSIKDQLLGNAPLPWEVKGPNAAHLRRLTFLRRHVLACLSRDPKARPTADSLLEVLTHLFEEVTTQGTETVLESEDVDLAAQTETQA